MTDERAYHVARARAEREHAARSADERASDAHMRLAALHLSRAMILEEIDARLGESKRREER